MDLNHKKYFDFGANFIHIYQDLEQCIKRENSIIPFIESENLGAEFNLDTGSLMHYQTQHSLTL